MTDNRTAVFGLYSNAIQTEGVVNALMLAGFSGADLSLVLPGESASIAWPRRSGRLSEVTATGVAGSTSVGGALGLLAGIGPLTVPGIGPVTAAGPIVATLAGIGAGTGDGLLHALIDMGLSEFDARRYEGRVKRGAILLCAHCESAEEVRRATKLLEYTGAEDIAPPVEEPELTTRH